MCIRDSTNNSSNANVGVLRDLSVNLEKNYSVPDSDSNVIEPVSYTHLDVYKRQQPGCWLRSSHAFKECVIAHWSSGSAPKIHRGSNLPPKLWDLFSDRSVGEQCIRTEAVPKGAVDCIQERMPV